MLGQVLYYNIDYKIVSRFMANRLKNVEAYFIKLDQEKDFDRVSHGFFGVLDLVMFSVSG